jgi:hypothetical protein
MGYVSYIEALDLLLDKNYSMISMLDSNRDYIQSSLDKEYNYQYTLM